MLFHQTSKESVPRSAASVTVAGVQLNDLAESDDILDVVDRLATGGCRYAQSLLVVLDCCDSIRGSFMEKQKSLHRLSAAMTL